MVSPENIHTCNILQTEHVIVSKNICIYVYYMCVSQQIIKIKETMNLKLAKKNGVWEGSAGGKEGGNDGIILQTQNKRQK